MNHKISTLPVIISAILSLAVAFFLNNAYYLVIAAIPLSMIAKKWSLLYGFLFGFLSLLSMYLLYPLSSSLKISVVLGSITSLPSILVLILYPLFGGLICGFGGLLFASIYELSGKKGNKKLVTIKNN